MSQKRGSTKRRSSRRRGALVLTVLVLALAAAAAGYVVTRGWPTSADPAAAGTPTTGATATEDPAGVSAPPSAVDDDAIGGESADPSSGQTVATDTPVVVTATSVPVVVTYSGWNAAAGAVQVGGFASGVVEDGGACTLTLTLGATRVSATAAAVADASTTACGQLSVPGSKLANGTWQAVLSYASASHTGRAAPVAVEVAR
jgi:hypothetical protein